MLQRRHCHFPYTILLRRVANVSSTCQTQPGTPGATQARPKPNKSSTAKDVHYDTNGHLPLTLPSH